VNAAGVVFSGTDGGVFRSQDEGDTWEAVNTGLGNLLVESLVVSRDDVLIAGTDNGVYRSLDDGETWTAVHGEALVTWNVRALVTTSAAALFAGVHGGGVFRSLNHGATWDTVNEALTQLDIHTLVAGSDGTLFAGTHGGGVFRRDASIDVSAEDEIAVPDQIELADNYPNPFNPSTRIRYALPRHAAVSLRVFDATGRLLAVLLDDEQAAGWHEVAFDAASLPSGVYYYRLQAEGFSEVRQMVLLR
jgi:ligand-binding sensor domain-containing protein